MPREQNAQIPMAVVGIVMKFFQIVISIVVGMLELSLDSMKYELGYRILTLLWTDGYSNVPVDFAPLSSRKGIRRPHTCRENPETGMHEGT